MGAVIIDVWHVSLYLVVLRKAKMLFGIFLLHAIAAIAASSLLINCLFVASWRLDIRLVKV